MDNVTKFISAFRTVRNKGQFKSHRKGNTGIGKTLEDAIGVIENNLQIPDLHGFEIKSQRDYSKSKVTLFSKSPSYPPKANNYLRLNYGSRDEKFPDIKVLHVSVLSTKWSKHQSGYSYILRPCDVSEKLYLDIKNTSSDELLENDLFWSYKDLKNKYLNKLSNLAFVEAETTQLHGDEFFYFKSCTLFYDTSFNLFLDLLKCGDIVFEIRIGAYKNKDKPKTYGKTHDHGSCFRIKSDNIYRLYKSSEKI